MSYEERLSLLKKPTLEERRHMLSFIECYKSIHRLNSLQPSMFFKFSSDFRPLKAKHCFKLKSVHAKLDSFKYLFLVRVIEPWNNLPKHVAEAGSLTIFKQRLKDHLGL